LKQLAAPRYDISEVWALIQDKLYPGRVVEGQATSARCAGRFAKR
jgi:hypothetical protein